MERGVKSKFQRQADTEEEQEKSAEQLRVLEKRTDHYKIRSQHAAFQFYQEDKGQWQREWKDDWRFKLE